MKKFYILLILIIFFCRYSFAKSVHEMDSIGNNASTSDLLYVQDVSDTSEASTGTGKKATLPQLLRAGDIFVDGVNVGIGSTNPGKTLDVVGSGRFSSTLSASSLTATGLNSGECVQTTTGGLLATTGSACGSGGGGSGTVNSGAAGYIAYYPSAGTTVDDLSAIYSNGTNIGIGTTGTTNTVSLVGTSAQSIGLLRNTGNSNGNNLTINAGGGTSGGTDLTGGDLILQSGQATGLGQSYVRLRVPSSAGSTGTTENTPVDRVVVVPGKTITNNTDTDLFTIDVATGTSCGGSFSWETSQTDGTEFQIMSGLTSYTVYNKGGTMAYDVVEDVGAESKVLSAGTLTNTFKATSSGTTFKVQVNHSSSLTPSSGHPRIQYTLFNNCYKNVTISGS